MWRDAHASEELIVAIAKDVLKFTNEATGIVSRIREILVEGPLDPPDPISEKARTRAFKIFEEIVSSSQNGFASLQARHANGPFSDWPKEEQDKARDLTQLAEQTAAKYIAQTGATLPAGADSDLEILSDFSLGRHELRNQ